jgi:RNA polymerase sigma-70 factor (ECF subfamily)
MSTRNTNNGSNFKELTGKNFNELYNKYNDSLIFYLNGKCKDVAQAQDLAADAWERAMDQINKYDKEKSAFNTWLFKVANNIFLQLVKDNTKNPHFSIDAESDESGMAFKDLLPNVESNILEENLNYKKAEIAKKRIMEMPEKYKNVLERVTLQGMKYEEIAHDLNLNLQTVKSQIRMGRAKLCKILENDFIKLEQDNIFR